MFLLDMADRPRQGSDRRNRYSGQDAIQGVVKSDPFVAQTEPGCVFLRLEPPHSNPEILK